DILTGTTSIAALSFTSPFKLAIDRAPASASSSSSSTFVVHSFLAHFDTYFAKSARLCDASLRNESVRADDGEIFFTTGAWDTPTHWKQTAFLLKDPLEVEIGSSIEGTIKVAKNPDNSRELLVEMVWNVVTKAGEKRETQAQAWKVR
ncbi:hypothetical protein JCM3766R1_000594, partial [Sporobolomyces carnicolor]